MIADPRWTLVPEDDEQTKDVPAPKVEAFSTSTTVQEGGSEAAAINPAKEAPIITTSCSLADMVASGRYIVTLISDSQEKLNILRTTLPILADFAV